MRTLIKIHFSGCEQTEVFISPLERALDGRVALKENPVNLHLETQKAFMANYPGKPLMGSNTEAPGGGLCFPFVDSEAIFPKVPQHTFFFFFNFFKPQTVMHIKSFLTFPHDSYHSVTVTLNENHQCMNFCFHFKYTKGYYVQVTHLFRQKTFLLHNKVHRGKGVSTLRTKLCAQAGSACRTPALLCMVMPSLF